MIHISNLGMEFGGTTVFKGLSLHIPPDARIGLVGPNGAGKTTLLRILKGGYTQTNGDVNARRGIRIGLLPQEEFYAPEGNVFAVAHRSQDELLSIEVRIRELDDRMARCLGLSKAEEDEYQELHEAFERRGGFVMEARVSTVLDGLGFPRDRWNTPAAELSGGWRRRLHLAGLLLESPDLLLLDEPTNHLDTTTIDWLEGFLKGFPGAVVLVSHDRYFLERVTGMVAEVGRIGSKVWKCRYGEYLEKKTQEEARLRKAWEEQKEFIEKTRAFIDKFRYNASKARLVQSRVKMLDKVDILEVAPVPKIMDMEFPLSPRTGESVLTSRDLSKSYGDLEVLKGVDLRVHRGDRVAVIGENGAGKTTLLKLFSGALAANSGTIEFGQGVMSGYYAQHTAEQLEPEDTVLGSLEKVSPLELIPRLRTLLGCFLFSADEVEKKIAVLSGGEKARVALCRLLLLPRNFLILDEPTNHLDIDSRRILIESLEKFQGTLVFVSHDRFFIDRLANRIFCVAHGKVRVFSGNYSAFLGHVAQETGRVQISALQQFQGQESGGSPGRVDLRESGFETIAGMERGGRNDRQTSKTERARKLKEERDSRNERKEREREIAALEHSIHQCEESVKQFEDLFLTGEVYTNPEKASALGAQLRVSRERLEILYNEWETAAGGD